MSFNMRSPKIAFAVVFTIFFGGCSREGTRAKVEYTDIQITAELQHHCILRSLALVFERGGMREIRRRYSGDKPINVIFQSFPNPSYPKHFEKHQLVRITKEDAARRIDAKEAFSFMHIVFGDRRPEGEILVNIDTHGYSFDSERGILNRGHGEGAMIEFEFVNGGLDYGTLAGLSIE